MDPSKNVITLRNKEGRVREVNRDIPIVKRQYWGRQLSVGAVKEQLSLNSICTEQTKRKESEEDTLTGGDAHQDTTVVVPPVRGRIRDVARIFRERVERPREEPRVNPANVPEEVQGTYQMGMDDNPSISNWRPAGYYPSTGPATVITSEPVESERKKETRTRTGEHTPMSQYSTVPNPIFVVKPRGEPNPSLEEAVKKLNEELNKLPRDESRKSDDGEEDYEDEGSSVFSTQTDSRSKAERKAERKSQKEEKRFRRRAEEIKEWASASAVGLPISSGSLRVSGYDQEFTSQDTKTPTNFKGKLPDPGNYGNVGLAFTSISDIDLQMEYLQAVKSRRMQEQEEERMRAKAARMQTSRSGYAGPSDWDASSLDRLTEKEKKEQLRTHRRYKSRSRSPSKEHNRDHDRKKEKNIKRDRVEHEVKHEYSTRQLHRGPPGIPDPSSKERYLL
ncbi:hypothetical protein ACEPAG_5358 [Sanghuangporus baumii]